MWLAQKMKPAVPEAEADQGVSTIVGDEMGVVTRGEVRRLPVYGPGGYVWLPESGASVLVIKGGSRRRGAVRLPRTAGRRHPRGCSRERCISTHPAASASI